MKPEAGFHICGRVTAKPEFSTTAKGRKFATFYVEHPGSEKMAGSIFRVSVFESDLLRNVLPGLRVGQNIRVDGSMTASVSNRGTSFVNLTAAQILGEPARDGADEPERPRRQDAPRRQEPRRDSFAEDEEDEPF